MRTYAGGEIVVTFKHGDGRVTGVMDIEPWDYYCPDHLRSSDWRPLGGWNRMNGVYKDHVRISAIDMDVADY